MADHKIIVVDDQPSVCREVVAFLKDAYTIHAFKSGEEALEHMASQPVDLVLLDYEMPNMTGYEVMLAMRMNKATKDTPIIFLTSWTKERMKEEMMGRGANDYLCKPVSAVELKQCIRKLLH